MEEGYTNIELLQGFFTDEMIQALLQMHGYTTDTLNQLKPSMMSEIVLSIVMDDQGKQYEEQLMHIKLQLLRVFEKEIEEHGDSENPRYHII